MSRQGKQGGADAGASGGEVWVWLPRGRDQELAPAAAEVLYEGGALARRLGAALAAYSGPAPTEADARWLAGWGVSVVRSLGRALPPHPVCLGGRSLLAPLLPVPPNFPPNFPPRAVLFSADTFGKVTAPLLAAELDAPYVAGASGLTLDGGRFVASRATLGERFEAVCRLDAGRPVVVTLLPGAVGESPRPPRIAADTTPPLQLETLPFTGAAGGTAPLLPPDPATLDLADAERIVAFGRGAFSEEAVNMVQALARALGAVVAGSRPAADEGWLPFSRQIGLTGAIVRPKLYVAVGISGAPYHMVGVKEPETLIAINNDPEAPIHAHAHLSLIGDLRQLVPALTRRVEQAGGALPAALAGGDRTQARTP